MLATRLKLLLIVVSLGYLSTIAVVSSQDDEFTCVGTDPVEVDENGQLRFPPLPEGGTEFTYKYDPAIGGWYDLANSFVDTVRPGDLPYDVLRDAINDNNLQCDIIEPEPPGCENEDGGDFDVEETFQDFADWWTPILAVTILGGLLGLAFLITGCCFCCCRCCGLCGASRKPKEVAHNDCKTFTFAIILLCFTLVLFVGVVLAFFTNEQAYDSFDSFQGTVDSVADAGLGYVRDSLDEADALLCQFDSVATILINEALGVNASVNEELDVFLDEALDILDTLEDLAVDLSEQGIRDITDVLVEIDSTSAELQSLSEDLNNTLANITDLVAQLESDCNANVTLSTSGVCDQIPGPETFQLANDYSDLPNVTDAINALNDTEILGIDIAAEIDQGRANFTQVTRDIRAEVSDPITDALDEVNDVNETVYEEWNDVRGEVLEVIRDDEDVDCPSIDTFCAFDLPERNGTENNIGEIRQCIVNRCFDDLREYDVYRYAFGVIICCLALIVVILVVVGIVLGMVGFRRDRESFDRTGVSHCGGILLIIAVGLAFLFGFFLLILSSLGFFFGSNGYKVCQSMEPLDFELFTEIVDNVELWRGSLLGSIIFDNGSEIFSISQALRNCEQDQPLYQAFNLSFLFDIREELVNFTSVVDDLEDDINDATNSFLENYDPEDFLTFEAQDALDDYVNDTVSTDDIQAFLSEIDAELLTFDIDTTISSLESVRSAAPQFSDTIDAIISELNYINDTILPAIDVQLGELNDSVIELDRVTSQVVSLDVSVNQLEGNLSRDSLNATLMRIVEEPIERIISFIDQTIDHFADELEMSVGRCQPLYGIYNELYGTICEEALDGLNGFWWSLGFCALFFIPVIIFAVITSTFFIRTKFTEGDEEFPMKTY